jgi:predicted small secreted protein
MKKPHLPCLLVLTAVTLGACGPNTMWSKEGASTDELRAARNECSSDASGYGFVDNAFYDGPERNRGSSAQSGVYRQCMENHGWRRQRTDQAPR